MARRPKTPEKTPEPEAKRGRTPKAENEQRLEKILELIKERPGITNPEVAAELGMTTLSTAQLVNRLVDKEEIVLWKLANAVRTYYMPAVFKKKEAALQKQFDADMEERKASASAQSRKAPAEATPGRRGAKKPTPAEEKPKRRTRKAA